MKEKKQNILKNKKLGSILQAFHLFPFLISAVLLLVIPPSADFCIGRNLEDAGRFAYEMAKLILIPLAWMVWLLLLSGSVLQTLYRQKTGRDYLSDRLAYHLSFRHLTAVFQDAEPHKLDTSAFPILSWTDAEGLVLGTDGKRLITLPSDSETNIAVFGPPGTGKTSGVAIPNACRFQGSVLAVDIKGDIYSYVHTHTDRTILRFAPDADDALTISCHFDPFLDIEDMNESDRKLFLADMAAILIKDEGGSDGNYFTSRARKLFQGITHLILYENPKASFPFVVHAILEGNVFDWVQKAIGSTCRPAKELLASFYGNSEKNVSGAYDALTTALISFSNPVLDRLLSKDPGSISIRTLDAGTDIYLQISQANLDAYAPIFTLILQSFSNAFTRRPDRSSGIKNRPVLLLMDEFPQLTFSYQMINRNLSTLRSKSIICMLIQQNLSQLEQKFQPIGARSILGNCSIQVILGSNDIYTSKSFSDMFGMKKALRSSSNVSSSAKISFSESSTVQQSEEKVFPPEIFGDLLSNGQEILYYKGKYARIDKLNCYIV